MDEDPAEEEAGVNLGGWGPKAWDLLQARVDALRSDVNVLMGKEPPSKNSDPRIAGVGLATWIALFATIVVPLLGTAALVVLHNP